MDQIEKYIDLLARLFREFLMSANQLNQDWWFIVAFISALTFYIAIFFQNRFIRIVFVSFSVIILVYEAVIYTNGLRIARELQIYEPRFREYFVAEFGAVFIISIIISFIIFQRLSIFFGSLKERFSKTTSIERLSVTDIRNIAQHLPKTLKAFKPEKYYKNGKIFLGLNPNKKAVLISLEKWRQSHLQVTGTTGCGKGIQGVSLCCQSLRSGETVIVFAPKDDEFAPHVLANECKKLNKEFYLIDLQGDNGQLNLFKDKSLYQTEELLIGGFGLSDIGTDADFYRLNDRKAARRFASFISNDPQPISDGVLNFSQQNDEIAKEAPKLLDSLFELATLSVLHTNGGIDLREKLESNCVIYIKGSMRNQKVLTLQKMLLLSLIQFCEQREREQATSVLFFLDEFKYLISRPSLEALGAIRDKKAHVILAHQSLGDLKDCPKDIDPESVVASVNENCSLKFVYKINDPMTAEHFAKMSGTIQIDKEMRTLNRNNALAETTDFQRTIRQDERYYIDTNIFQSLPERCGVIFGNGLAELAFTSPIIVKKDDSLIQPTVFDNDAPPTTRPSFTNDVEVLIDVVQKL